MIARQFLSCLALSVTLAICIHSLARAEPATDDTIQLRLQKEKERLEQLRAKIEKQEEILSQVKKKETRILDGLGRLENNLMVKEKELQSSQERIESNQSRIVELSIKIHRLEQSLREQETVLGKRLRHIHKEGEMFPLKVMFSADNFNELIQRIKYMEMITAYDSALFQNFRRQIGQLGDERKALEQASVTLENAERETRAKALEFQKEKAGKNAFLLSLKKEKDLTLQAQKEFEQSSERLTRLIMELENKLVSGEGIEFAEAKGYLQLPTLGGKQLNSFGKKLDESYGAYIVHNGINIKIARGTTVRSVFDGKVLFNGYLEGYGNLVIIGHGSQYHSLYGHLSESTVVVGKTVKRGDVIGRSGDTGSLVGESLYFELRHQGQPIDPNGWFKVAKK
jgi:septal ring factor EnvC (AmiA/AmiB activator)